MQNVAMGLGRFADVNFMSYNTKKCATLVIEKPKDKYLPSTVIRNPAVAFAVRNRFNLNSTDDSDTTVSSDSEDDWVAGRAELLRRRKMPTMTHRIVLDADDSDEEGENGHTLNPRSATYKLRSQPIVLNGQKVPIGERYEYLGLGFNNNLDLKQIPLDRAAKGLRSLGAACQVIGSSLIAIEIRVLCLKAVVLPCLSFGSEILFRSLNGSFVKATQKMLNKAMYCLIRGQWSTTCNRPGTACNQVMYSELGLPTLQHISAQSATRLLIKAPHSKLDSIRIAASTDAPIGNSGTWRGKAIALVTKLKIWFGWDFLNKYWTNKNVHPSSTRCSGWLDTPAGRSTVNHGPFNVNDLVSLLDSAVFRENHFNVFDSGNPTTPLGDFARREAKIVARAVDLYQQRSVEEPSDGWKRYVKSGYKRSSSIFRKLSLACPELAREMHWILRIRCGALISWHHAKKHCNAAIKTAAKGCGCCREDNIADSLDHFFFRCDPTLEAADAVHINGSLTTHPLKAARQAVNLQKTANLLARAVVDFHFSFGPDKRKLKQLDFSKPQKRPNPVAHNLRLTQKLLRPWKSPFQELQSLWVKRREIYITWKGKR